MATAAQDRNTGHLILTNAEMEVWVIAGVNFGPNFGCKKHMSAYSIILDIIE